MGRDDETTVPSGARSYPPDLPVSGAWGLGDAPGRRQFLRIATPDRPFALEGGGVLPDATIAEAHARFHLGRYLLREGREAEAQVQMAEASRLHPDSWAMWRQAAAKPVASSAPVLTDGEQAARARAAIKRTRIRGLPFSRGSLGEKGQDMVEICGYDRHLYIR